MKIAITGASGHLGANIVRALLEDGQDIRALIHVDRRALETLDIEKVQCDICDLDSLHRAFTGIDTVYHLAGYISITMDEQDRLERINVAGTRNVVNACLQNGVRRLVYFSSIHALEQKPFDIPVDESRPLVQARTCPPYDFSKASGELEIRKGIENGLDAILINPTAIIGPYDYRPSHFGEALLTLARGKLPAMVNGGFDWVDARDVAAGAIQAEKQAPRGAKYLLSGHWVSVQEMAGLVEEITGTPTPRFVCPLWLAPLGTPFITGLACATGKRPLYTSVSLKALCSNHNISHQKATDELGYRTRPFRDTIIDTLHWFKENGYYDRNLNL
jgi:dihydroflavonol-4-reductase